MIEVDLNEVVNCNVSSHFTFGLMNVSIGVLIGTVNSTSSHLRKHPKSLPSTINENFQKCFDRPLFIASVSGTLRIVRVSGLHSQVPLSMSGLFQESDKLEQHNHS
jgi:hypothetical protein